MTGWSEYITERRPITAAVPSNYGDPSYGPQSTRHGPALCGKAIRSQLSKCAIRTHELIRITAGRRIQHFYVAFSHAGQRFDYFFAHECSLKRLFWRCSPPRISIGYVAYQRMFQRGPSPDGQEACRKKHRVVIAPVNGAAQAVVRGKARSLYNSPCCGVAGVLARMSLARDGSGESICGTRREVPKSTVKLLQSQHPRGGQLSRSLAAACASAIKAPSSLKYGMDNPSHGGHGHDEKGFMTWCVAAADKPYAIGYGSVSLPKAQSSGCLQYIC